ncbi:amidase [Naumannella sp. ID2617S]|nr:amidase [Naumannella sp. ID2617S]
MSEHFQSAQQLVRAYAAGERSPVQELQRVLDRTAELQPLLNAMSRMDTDTAWVQARAAEQRWRGGAARGPLDGVPITIKDNIPIAGRVARGGSRATPDTPAVENGPVVDRLLEAGAVIVGATVMPDWGCKGVGDSPQWGTTRNPWDRRLTPGGSSSGAAAGVAAGMTALSIGSDGAGSIRMPAGFCGLAGIKPTYGRVAALPGSAFGSLSHQGPITRTVSDLAVLLDVIAQPDDRDGMCWPGPRFQVPQERALTGVRVGVGLDWGPFPAEPDVREAVHRTAEWLAARGATVQPVQVDVSGARETLDLLWESGCASVVAKAGPEQRELFDDTLLYFADRAANHTAVQYADAMAARTTLAGRFAQLHRDSHVLLTPVTTTPAFDVDTDIPAGSGMGSWLDWAPYTYPFNLTGQPAITVPAGVDGRNRPIGVQLVGPRFADQLLLDLAAAIEADSGGFEALSEGGRRLDLEPS